MTAQELIKYCSNVDWHIEDQEHRLHLTCESWLGADGQTQCGYSITAVLLSKVSSIVVHGNELTIIVELPDYIHSMLDRSDSIKGSTGPLGEQGVQYRSSI